MSRADFVPGSQGNLEQFGIDRVLWPEAQLAADIERVVTAPGAIDAEVFAGGVIRLLEYRLGDGSTLTSAPLGQLHLPRGSLIVAVKRGAQLFVPRGTTELAAGDKIILMGTPEAMLEVEALVNPARARRPDARDDHRRRRRRPAAGRAAREGRRRSNCASWSATWRAAKCWRRG